MWDRVMGKGINHNDILFDYMKIDVYFHILQFIHVSNTRLWSVWLCEGRNTSKFKAGKKTNKIFPKRIYVMVKPNNYQYRSIRI